MKSNSEIMQRSKLPASLSDMNVICHHTFPVLRPVLRMVMERFQILGENRETTPLPQNCSYRRLLTTGCVLRALQDGDRLQLLKKSPNSIKPSPSSVTVLFSNKALSHLPAQILIIHVPDKQRLGSKRIGLNIHICSCHLTENKTKSNILSHKNYTMISPNDLSIAS